MDVNGKEVRLIADRQSEKRTSARAERKAVRLWTEDER